MSRGVLDLELRGPLQKISAIIRGTSGLFFESIEYQSAVIRSIIRAIIRAIIRSIANRYPIELCKRHLSITPDIPANIMTAKMRIYIVKNDATNLDIS
jgi:hypothetical protein